MLPDRVSNAGHLTDESVPYRLRYTARLGRVERTCSVNFQFRGVLLDWIIAGQGPSALKVGAGWSLFGHFFLSSIFSLFFLPVFGRRPDID